MNKSKYILSDPQALKQIMLFQYIWRGISVVIMALGFFLGTFTGLHTPFSIVVGVGVGLFLTSGFAHRFKNKIPVPDEHMFVSPIQGKLRYAHQNEETTVININRIFLDLVEIRSPHPNAFIEDGMLKVKAKNGTITLRFNKLKVRWLPNPDFARGMVIGIIRGHGSCTISVPTIISNSFSKDQNQDFIIPKLGQALDICDNLFELED